MTKEAALIIGAVVAGLNAIVTVAGLGAFDDGLQWADLVPILLPILGALGIRQNVYSEETVAMLAPPEVGARSRR